MRCVAVVLLAVVNKNTMRQMSLFVVNPPPTKKKQAIRAAWWLRQRRKQMTKGTLKNVIGGRIVQCPTDRQDKTQSSWWLIWFLVIELG